jgi:hypothetical protein
VAEGVRELVPENGSLVREGSLAKSFSSYRGNPKDTGVGRGAELAGRCVEMEQSRKVLWTGAIKRLVAESSSFVGDSLLNR